MSETAAKLSFKTANAQPPGANDDHVTIGRHDNLYGEAYHCAMKSGLRTAALSFRRNGAIPTARDGRQLKERVSSILITLRFNSSIPPPRRPIAGTETKTEQKPESSSQTTLGGTWRLLGTLDRAEPRLTEKVNKAWSTPTKWYPIPIALGALVLLAVQYRKQTREELEIESQGEGGAVLNAKKNGPWQVSRLPFPRRGRGDIDLDGQVRVLGALPLRSLSQLWGYLNGLVLPVWFRPFGFKLYAKIFGCNLEEVPEDLTAYDSLGSFFYREMKEGRRPIADAPMVSFQVIYVTPSDGQLLMSATGITSRRSCFTFR